MAASHKYWILSSRVFWWPERLVLVKLHYKCMLMGRLPIEGTFAKSRVSDTCEHPTLLLWRGSWMPSIGSSLSVSLAFLQSTCWSKDYYLKNYKIYKIIFFLHVFYLIYPPWKECKVHNAPLNRPRLAPGQYSWPTSSCSNNSSRNTSFPVWIHTTRRWTHNHFSFFTFSHAVTWFQVRVWMVLYTRFLILHIFFKLADTRW